MAAIARKIGKWSMIIIATISLLAFVPWGFIAGDLMARLDLARGNSKILVYGLPVPWREQGVSILHNRYRVEMKPIAGCVVSQWTMNFARGYNAVSEAAITARVGHDVIDESLEEARIDWQRTHPRDGR